MTLEKKIKKLALLGGVAAISSYTAIAGFSGGDNLAYNSIVKNMQENKINNNSFFGHNNSKLEYEVEMNIKRIKGNIDNIKRIQDSFSDLSKYRDYIESDLAYAVFATESSGDIKSVSPKGATGGAQFMSRTAKDVGLNVGEYIDERCSPKAFRAGEEYLMKLCRRFGANYLGVMAYNHGEGNIEKLIRKYGKGWKELKKHLPTETKNYVVRVFSREKLLSQGFPFKKKQLFSQKLNNSKKITVRNGDTIYDIAQRNDMAINDLKDLNPSIKDYKNIVPGMNVYVNK